MDTGDTELLQRVRAGDGLALDLLLKRYEERIYAFGMRLCREPEDARDVLQETLLTLARSADSFEGRSSLSTWLFTVARSFCIKQRRRRVGAPERLESLDDAGRFEASEPATTARAPDDAAADRQLADAIETALARLDEPMREVVVLRDIEGLSAAETAEVLGVSVAATKSRLHRARTQLRALLSPVFGPDADRDDASTCPDIQRLWSRHQEGEISASTCAEMEAHVAACPRCERVCDSLGRTLAQCRATPGPALPAAVQRSVRDALRAASG
ncbi:MAG: sigma-70 family RNA polymerase sigma factor [Myxococcota bacterium]